MRDCNIQKRLGYCRFRLHDIPVSVISLGYLRMQFCLGSAAYLVHLPKDVFEKLLLFIVHRCYFLSIVGIGIDFDGVDGKHIFPNRTASAHFKLVIADGVLYLL